MRLSWREGGGNALGPQEHYVDTSPIGRRACICSGKTGQESCLLTEVHSSVSHGGLSVIFVSLFRTPATTPVTIPRLWDFRSHAARVVEIYLRKRGTPLRPSAKLFQF